MNAHSEIERQVIVAADGTVTLPASVAESAGWTAGMTLDLFAAPAKVSLSTPREKEGTMTADEVFARLREINPYRGPMVTDDEMHEIVTAAAVERYQRSF